MPFPKRTKRKSTTSNPLRAVAAAVGSARRPTRKRKGPLSRVAMATMKKKRKRV